MLVATKLLEQSTPLTSLLMWRMLAEVGAAEGGSQAGDWLWRAGAGAAHQVDFVHFTGSDRTGRRVMARAAETLTPRPRAWWKRTRSSVPLERDLNAP